jgi:RTX calcium-binding nonapeptide repeat (4 copies)
VRTRGVVVLAVTVFLVAAGAAWAAVTAEFFSGTLSISSDAGDAIAVTCTGGTAKVNGAEPEGGPAPCGAVESVEISGGPDANAIDLAGVTSAAFSSVEYISVLTDDGADTVTGSALTDEIDGEADDDTLRGNAGNDALNGSDGDDRVFGGAGNDTITAAVGNDALDGQAGSDTYQLDLTDLGPNVRVADTGAEGTDTIDLADCEGVTVEPGRISFEQARVTVSGIESYPCGFAPPPAPPAPPAPQGPAATKQACVVPRLRGRTLVRARTALVRAHCALGKVRRVHSRFKRGVVVAQRPRAGVRKARGAKVALRVSRGP